MKITPINFIQSVTKVKESSKNALYASFYVQKPDTFERNCPVNFTGKSNRIKEYGKIINTLQLTHNNAQISLNGQLALDGWAGKTADYVSGLWNSKNRAHLVQADIDTYQTQIDKLNNSIKKDEFKQTFQEIFGVPYNHANINKYNKKANEFKTAVTTKCMAEITAEKLSKDLEIFKQSKGILQDKEEKKFVPNAITCSIPYFVEITPKKDILSNLEENLVGVIGSKEVLNKVLTTNGMNVEQATDEQKYKAYGLMAEYLVETSKITAEKTTKGKSLADLKKEYERSYEHAYGHNNDIQERVDKYNRSQEIGAAAVRGVARSGLSAALMLMAPAAGFGKILASTATTFGVKVLVDGSDKMSNNIDNSVDLDFDGVKKLIKSSAISAAENFASGGLGQIIPNFNTGNELLDFGLEQSKGVVIDTSLGMISEKFKQGKWNKDQIVPRMVISAVFRNLGTDSELIKELLKLTKGGINQAMKKHTRDYDIVQQFIQGTKVTLAEEYLKDGKTFAELNLYASKYPNQYEEMMVGLLQEQVDVIKKQKI